MKHHYRFLILALFFTLSGTVANAQTVAGAPNFIDYQGRVLDGAGNPLSPTTATNYKMYFRIFDVQTGGAAANLKWAERQVVTVKNGEFSVRLGEGSVIGTGEAQFTSGVDDPRPSELSTVFSGKDRYLSVAVGADASTPPTAEILPRLRFLSSPYSQVSQRTRIADEVNGKVTATDGSSMTGSVNLSGATITGGNFSGGNFSGTYSGTTYTGTTITASSSFVGPGTIPVGGIIMWSGSIASVPSGWKLCDGLNGTPDLRGRFVLGAGTGNAPLTARTTGQTGGAETHTLTAAEMPAHIHNAQGYTNTDGNHTHNYWSGYNNNDGVGNGEDDENNGRNLANNTTHGSGAHRHYFNVNTSSVGSNAAHNNLPPYYVLAFIMRSL